MVEMKNIYKVIPAMDIIDGGCVRLTMGDYGMVKKYSSNPLDVAKDFENAGFKKIHIVDLDGAKSNAPRNLQIVKDVSQNTRLEIQFGGGIKSLESAVSAFEYGADSIILGSVAVKQPEIVARLIELYGKERIILGVDVKEGKISINGWKEQVNIDINKFISSYATLGINRVICTDISKDGMLSGPTFQLYQNLKQQFPSVNIIASGGVSSEQDIIKLISMGIDGVIAGKAFYENKIDINFLVEWLQNE